jgi:hypothetical protein
MAGSAAFIPLACNPETSSTITLRSFNAVPSLTVADIEGRETFAARYLSSRLRILCCIWVENELNVWAELLRELEQTLLTLKATKDPERRRLLLRKMSRLFAQIDRD